LVLNAHFFVPVFASKAYRLLSHAPKYTIPDLPAMEGVERIREPISFLSSRHNMISPLG